MTNLTDFIKCFEKS